MSCGMFTSTPTLYPLDGGLTPDPYLQKPKIFLDPGKWPLEQNHPREPLLS